MSVARHAAAAALFIAPLASASMTLYSQPLDVAFPGAARGGSISEGVSGGFFDQRKADNFTLAAGGSIESIAWWGTEEGFFSVGFPGNRGSDNVAD